MVAKHIADPGYGDSTEDTLSGFFSEMQANTPDSCPIHLINVDLLPTAELFVNFKLNNGSERKALT